MSLYIILVIKTSKWRGKYGTAIAANTNHFEEVLLVSKIYRLNSTIQLLINKIASSEARKWRINRFGKSAEAINWTSLIWARLAFSTNNLTCVVCCKTNKHGLCSLSVMSFVRLSINHIVQLTLEDVEWHFNKIISKMFNIEYNKCHNYVCHNVSLIKILQGL